MKITQKTWKVDKVVANRAKINLNPSWQRGPAWKLERKILLIDSILRGMDIPKIYLRKLGANGTHTHDAVDGQQRLRAIWEFRAGDFALNHREKLAPIGSHAIQGQRFAGLHGSLRSRFDAFTVSVAEITDASNDEITNLFARLQLGVALNPAELRNAMLGPVRHMVESCATGHAFWKKSRIPATRYKRQDYVAHLFGILAYKGTRNIKAPDLKMMMREFGPDQSLQVLALAAAVDAGLTVLLEVDRHIGHRLLEKWLFVDLAWLIMQEQAAGNAVDSEELARNFHAFDDLRRRHLKQPEALLSAGGDPRKIKLNRALYDYIMAFRTQGGTHVNLKKRNVALRAYCI